MNRSVYKDAVVTVFIGAAYYAVHTLLVGFAAAIAFPDWYRPFAETNPTLALVLFAFMTTIPAAALAALPTGFAIVTWVSANRVLWAFVIVFGSTVVSALSLGLDGGLFENMKVLVLPSSLIDVPGLFAWWTFLPLCVFLFMSGRRPEKAPEAP